MRRPGDLIPIAFIVPAFAFLLCFDEYDSGGYYPTTYLFLFVIIGSIIASIRGVGLQRKAKQAAIGTFAAATVFSESLLSFGDIGIDYYDFTILIFLICLVASLNMIVSVWSTTNERLGIYRLNWFISIVINLILRVATIKYASELLSESIDELSSDIVYTAISLLTVVAIMWVLLFSARPGQLSGYDPHTDKKLQRITPWAPLLLMISCIMIYFMHNTDEEWLAIPDSTYNMYVALCTMIILVCLATLFLMLTWKSRRAFFLKVTAIMVAVFWLLDSVSRFGDNVSIIFSSTNMLLFWGLEDTEFLPYVGVSIASAVLLVTLFSIVKKSGEWSDRSRLILALLLSSSLAIAYYATMTGLLALDSISGQNNEWFNTSIAYITAFLATTSLALNIIPRPDYMEKEKEEDKPPAILTQLLPGSIVGDGRPKGPIIDDRAFYNCKSLKVGIIPEGTVYIGDSAFFGCTEMEAIYIPNTVISIGKNAFFGCTKLTKVVIPESVTNICDNAFFGCTALRSVVMPKNISIGDNAFSGCTSLLVIDDVPVQLPDELPPLPENSDEEGGENGFDGDVQELPPEEPVPKKKKKKRSLFRKKRVEEEFDEEPPLPANEPAKEPVVKEKTIEGFGFSEIYGKPEPYVSEVKKVIGRRCPYCNSDIGAYDKGISRCPYCGERLPTNELKEKKKEE